jgi:predicted phage-related endonuclease
MNSQINKKPTGKLTNSFTHTGSSEAAIIMYGESRFGKKIEEHRQRVTSRDMGSDTFKISQKAIRRGNLLEHPLAQYCLEELKQSCEDVTELPTDKADVHKTLPVAASCDQKIFVKNHVDIECPVTKKTIRMSGLIINEIKTDGYESGEPHRDYYCQLQHQLLCTGAQFGCITKLGPKLELEIYPYERDEDFIAELTEKVVEFWDRVERDDPYIELPDTNFYVAELDNLDTAPQVEALVDQYNTLITQKTGVEDLIKETKDALCQILKEVETDTGTIGGYLITNKRVEKKPKPGKWTEPTPGSHHYRFNVKPLGKVQ